MSVDLAAQGKETMAEDEVLETAVVDAAAEAGVESDDFDRDEMGRFVAAEQEKAEAGGTEADEEPAEVETEVAAETETKTEAAATSPAGFSDELIARAGARQISPEEAAAFGSPEALEVALRVYDRQFVARELAGAEQEAEAGQQTTTTGSEAADTLAAAGIKLPEALDPEIYGDGIVEMQSQYNEAISKLSARLDELTQAATSSREAVATEQATKFVSWLDEKISKLEPEFHAVLGKGETLKLDRAGNEFVARHKLVAAMNAIRKLEPKATDDEILESAINALHGGLVKKTIENKQVRNLRSQSARRLGTGATAKSVAADASAEGYNVLKDPELIDAFKKLKAENGED